MLAIQFEGCLVMVKGINFPPDRIMASQAVCRTIVLKLPVMDVGMARCAGFRETGKYLYRPSLRIFPEMTGTAALLRVCLR